MHSVPPPALRIVPTGALHAHETHDHQRSAPLIERLRSETLMINPPLVTPLETAPPAESAYIILDGANRAFAFAALGYPHILVQVAAYGSPWVSLETWGHLVCGWDKADFTESLGRLPGVSIHSSAPAEGIIARIDFSETEARWLTLADAPVTDVGALNRALRALVESYHHHGVLHRTVQADFAANRLLYPDVTALIAFRPYTPDEVLASARLGEPLPPGVSRHIVHGRAVRVNYPLALLADPAVSLAAKNAALESWLREKAAHRAIRYYAEATYQFDE
jgi:hypothetical protein